MNLLLGLLRLHTPGFVRRRALGELYEATADAFGRAMPPLDTPSFSERLRSYAFFTAERAEAALEHEADLDGLKARLHRNARRLGERLRERFGLVRKRDTMAAARILYRIIDIDFQGSPDGDILIRRCYFSRFYSPRACELVSALDEGLLAGLAGGGTLTFTERITQGSEACRACFLQGPAPAGVRKEGS